MAQAKRKNVCQRKKTKLYPVAPREEIILLALSGVELYGLEIIRAISEISGSRYEMKMGSLYPSLSSLKDKKLIKERAGLREREKSGGAIRVYYRLTPLGEQIISEIQDFRDRLRGWNPLLEEEAEPAVEE